jgi:CheY-like chemotaxis protein
MGCGSILVIEDDDGVRETLRLVLDIEGYPVFTAANGQEGLELLPKLSHPCLILLDLMMPIMDGWAFAEAIDRDPVLATIPVVVVTAFEGELVSLKKKCGVIKKPIDLDHLMKVVVKNCGYPVR